MKELIIEINNFFFSPAKPAKELENEILLNLDKFIITKSITYIDNLSFFPNLKNIYFSFKENKFFILNLETKNYSILNLIEIRKILSDYIESSNLEKFFKNYIQQLKTLNEWDQNLELNNNFIYFQNCLFDTEKKE